MTVALFASAVATATLDQVSKGLVTGRLTRGEFRVLAGSLGLQRITNSRAGLLPLSDRWAVVVWVAVVACLGLVGAIGPPVPGAGDIGLGLVFGGATSNLTDRLARGGVVDFIVVGRWPTFNLADAAMVVGTTVAVWSLG